MFTPLFFMFTIEFPKCWVFWLKKSRVLSVQITALPFSERIVCLFTSLSRLFSSSCTWIPSGFILSSDSQFQAKSFVAILLAILLILEFISIKTIVWMIVWNCQRRKLIPLNCVLCVVQLNWARACPHNNVKVYWNLRHITLLEFNLDREPNASTHSSRKWKWCNDKWSRLILIITRSTFHRNCNKCHANHGISRWYWWSE